MAQPNLRGGHCASVLQTPHHDITPTGENIQHVGWHTSQSRVSVDSESSNLSDLQAASHVGGLTTKVNTEAAYR